jgi:polyvinyl alcohol dehydrogenase (cytochrome)
VAPKAGRTCPGGVWSALNPATGRILWRTCDPASAVDSPPVSVADGEQAAVRLRGQ